MIARRPVLLAASVLVVFAVAGPAGTAAAAGPDPAGTNSCRVQTATSESPDWLDSAAGQRVNTALARELDRRFGAPSEADPLSPVRSSLIGTTVDPATRSIVVVIDPALPGREALSQALSGVAVRARGAGFAAGPTVRVQAACHTSAQLLDANRVLMARDWHPDARKAPVGFYMDPADATFHVTVDTRYPDVATALRDRLGDVVTVALGSPSRFDRANDGSPHSGGALIHAGNAYCTAGFGVLRSDGYRGSVTAGHCYDNNTSVYSGSNYYGITDRESSYPSYDMIAISSSSELYSNGIYVDPCCPSYRYVTGRGNPDMQSLVCVSGAFTGARCGLRVLNWNGSLCDSAGCTTGLITARRDNGTVVTQHGDSGAPMYSKPDPQNYTATIRGLFIGSPDGGVTVLAELVSSVEGHLGVTVLTS